MIEIKIVKGRRMLKQFIDYPVKLYAKDPNFTPYLYSEEWKALAPHKNPAEAYCQFRLFLAYRDGKIVGRICGIINSFANKKYQQSRVRFNRLDMIDDIEVTRALVGAVEDFGRENGMTEINGPLGYSDQDREGLLNRGFDQKNMFVTFYTWPYYVKHLELLGFKEDATWLERKITIPKEGNARIARLAHLVTVRDNFHLVEFKRKRAKDIEPYVEKALSLVNVCYKDLYGYVEVGPDEMAALAREYVPLVNVHYLQFVENEANELVGFGLMIPSPSLALKKSKGKLFPFGWIGFLHALRTSKSLDMLLIAIRPDCQNSGAAAIILNAALNHAVADGIEYAETGPELETNEKVQRLWKYFDAPVHKRRSAYLKPIEDKTA